MRLKRRVDTGAGEEGVERHHIKFRGRKQVENLLHASADALMRTLARAEALLARGGAPEGGDRLRLIVIDSIANLFRTSDAEELRGGKRWSELYRVARALKEIAFAHGVVVLVVNQVTDVVTDDDGGGGGRPADALGNRTLAASGQFMSLGRMVVPSLVSEDARGGARAF